MVWLWPDRLCDSTQPHDQWRYKLKFIKGCAWKAGPHVKWTDSMSWKWFQVDVFVCLFFFISVHSSVLVLLPESCRPRSEPMSFFQGIRLVMGHGPYAKLVTVFLFTSLAFMVGIERHTRLLRARLVWTVSKSQLCFSVFILKWLISQTCQGILLNIGSPGGLTYSLCFIPSSWRETLPCSAAPRWVSETTSRIFCWSSWCVYTQTHTPTRRWHFQTCTVPLAMTIFPSAYENLK